MLHRQPVGAGAIFLLPSTTHQLHFFLCLEDATVNYRPYVAFSIDSRTENTRASFSSVHRLITNPRTTQAESIAANQLGSSKRHVASMLLDLPPGSNRRQAESGWHNDRDRVPSFIQDPDLAHRLCGIWGFVLDPSPSVQSKPNLGRQVRPAPPRANQAKKTTSGSFQGFQARTFLSHRPQQFPFRVTRSMHI
jgi:hypothetical protein